MRLTKIKLAGFKSFVDPTTFHIPSNLVAVVGPNGCGKSNVIDAVRWVMGESSARSLRGESLADVIFNGSSARKPVGQASIELVFDNSEGKLGGSWSQYNEIAVRRLLTRDGQSNYYLNSVRCRRKDITDIFLGTGLGPRSYAIVEQGTISQLIDAKPEELRVFLEEAAGVSKYRERRRESETRIRNTRENLARLEDLRGELNRQLQHLQRQARVAEQYQRYRAQERQRKAQLLVWRWRALDEAGSVQEGEIREQETALEAKLAEQRRLEVQLEAGRERQQTLTMAFNQAQERYYAVGTEIARLEQTLAYQRELRQRQSEELRQIEQALTQLLAQIHQDEDQIKVLELSLREAEAALEQTHRGEMEASIQVARAETALQDWQEAWDALSRRASESERLADVERTRIEHLGQQLERQQRQLERLHLEQDSLSQAVLEQELEKLKLTEQSTGAALGVHLAELAEIDSKLHEWREIRRHLMSEANALREGVQSQRGRLVSLQTLQEAVLGAHDRVSEWLERQGLRGAPRLAQCLTVETGWGQAVEIVLADYLRAVCVQDLQGVTAAVADLQQGGLILLETGTATGGGVTIGQMLFNKIQTPWPLEGVLAGVQVAADIDEAMARRATLVAGESIVTPQGEWIGRHWLRVTKGSDAGMGVLNREREIRALETALERDGLLLGQLSEALDRNQSELHAMEQRRNTLQDAVNQGHREQVQLQGQMNVLLNRLQHIQARRAAIAEERRELNRQMELERCEWQEAKGRLEATLIAMESLLSERQRLLADREDLRKDLEQRRYLADTSRQATQRQALAVGSLHTKLSAAHQALERLEHQREQLDARCQQLVMTPLEQDESVVQGQLQALLAVRITSKQGLAEAHQALEAQNVALRDLEQAHSLCQRQLQAMREALEVLRLTWKETSVQRQALVEQLREMEVDLPTVLAELPDELEEARWQAELEQLSQRIQRLGAVNLAAIEEFSQLSERKCYLDAQNEDLLEALATLESAIRKIDRETRSRFRDTFERVNERLQALFPRLFGGGRAYLELLGEDWLEAGVAIMAQPPGKRVGTIHLLSGGEKALTAIALIFAFFQLNPAPFCMLDEVDAPLDEANVGRFGELVREMSERVQFVLITHNKATMEVAYHLAGVTMHEPGVSRLVAVDVEEAVRLAAV